MIAILVRKRDVYPKSKDSRVKNGVSGREIERDRNV